MSLQTIDNIGWARRLRACGYAGACMLVACTGQIEPDASPLVDNTQQNLDDATNEPLKLPDYPDQIQIQRDKNGVPHISAHTEPEGYAALCYSMAKDRFFQLDFLRRSNQGRVAELFGAGEDGAIVESDKLARVLNISQLARDRFDHSMTKEAKSLVTACSTGINYYIKEATKNQTLPLELGLLKYTPDTWQPADSLAISMWIATNLDLGILLTKLQYSALSVIFGGDVAAALIPSPPELSMFDAMGKLNPAAQFVTGPGKGGGKKPSKAIRAPGVRRGWRPPQRRSTGLGSDTSGPESNNYAVDGSQTKSKHPLVANDPHLPLTTPSLAYAAQLQVDTNINGQRMNVEGITFPGLPLFVSARTDTTSWAVTFLLLDDVDLYQETIKDPASGTEVVVGGGVVRTRPETINVAQGQPVTIQVEETAHGPVLNAAFPTLDAFGKIALKSTMAQTEWSVEGVMNLPRTSKWADFRQSASQCGIGFNFLFSDETGGSGKIGYQASGLVPRRPVNPATHLPDNAFGVVPADGTHEWIDFAPADALPKVYDPPSHVLATGNNRIVPDDYSFYITNYYDTPWRAQRLYTRLLKSSAKLSIDDFASIQLDTYSVFNAPLRDTLVRAINNAKLPKGDPSAADALDALKKWDGKADANSQGAAVYETLLFVLLSDTVSNAIGPELYSGYASSVFITQQLQGLRDLLESPRAPFFGLSPDPQVSAADAGKARDAAVSVALGKADALLRAAIGDQVSKWSWGAVHALKYNHPLQAQDKRFKIGSFPASGDGTTPLIGGFFLNAGLLASPEQLKPAQRVKQALAQDALQVVRAVWEPSSKDRSLVTLSTGESGDPRSAHYSDQAESWRDGELLQMPYNH